MNNKLPIKESYLLLIIIIGILSLCMYSSFALFSLEKTTSSDIVTMKSASDIKTNLKIFEYKQIKVSAGDNKSVMVNVVNDTGNSVYYGVFYEMINPSSKVDGIGIYKIDYSTNPTVGYITNKATLPVEILIINDTSSDITLNIGVVGSDSNELGLPEGKQLILDTFNMGTLVSDVESTSVNFDYTGSIQAKTLNAGKYKLEVWGAEGGSYNTSTGGYGGYSTGIIDLSKQTTIYIAVGGTASTACNTQYCAGGYNGGGRGAGSSHPVYSTGGGGATHISLQSKLLKDLSGNLDNILIVAGGGGGVSYQSSQNLIYSGNGGSGGGYSGGNGTTTQSDYDYGKGATQSSGGAGVTGSLVNNTARGSNGSFGAGGDGNYYSAGGGAGFYGGGASNQSGAGGGSGYIANKLLTNKVMYCYNCQTTTENEIRTNTTNCHSVNPTSNCAKEGNGYAKITNLGQIPSIDTSSVSINNSQVTKFKDIVTCEDNGTGCSIVLVKPSNSKDLSEGSHNITYVLEDSSGNRYKYIKPVNIGVIASLFVESLDDKSTGDSGSGVYKVHHDEISSTDSVTGEKIPAIDDYRYYGKSPNNYVCLDFEGSTTCPDKHLYRIIGSIYDELEGTNRLKLIKATSLGDGTVYTFAWNYKNVNYENIWATPTETRNNIINNYSNSTTSGSSLMIMLNSGIWWSDTINTGRMYDDDHESGRDVDFTNYKLSSNAKSMIGDSRYYLAGHSDSKITTTIMYTYERTKTGYNGGRYNDSRPYYWEGKVALIYPSDYGYAAGITCVNGTNLWDYDTSCINNDWLMYSTPQWLLSPISSDYLDAFIVGGTGTVSISGGVDLGRPFRPVFSLKPEVTITGGSGTSSSPYVLSI